MPITDETKPLFVNPFIARQGEKIRARPRVDISPETMEAVAGFHPVLGPALAAKDFYAAAGQRDVGDMGLAALGMVPVMGGAAKVAKRGYEAFKSMPDVAGMFRTSRGSTYAHFPDATTVRNRSGAAHSDVSEGVQPRSGKTVFMNPKDVDSMAGIFQNTEMATKLVPEFDKVGKATGRVILQLTENYGPRKAGEVLHTAPYTTKPSVGQNPVEIYKSVSPMGDAGRGVHFGNSITEVMPARGYKGGGTVMPEQYSQGRWSLI